MKKSIFLFFAAILCAMTANAQWYLMGTVTDWSSGKQMTGDSKVVSVTINLKANTSYELKIKNGNSWYGNGGTMSSTNNLAWGFSTSNGSNAKIKTTDAGDYTFTWYISDKKLSVTYPNHNYIVAGDGDVMEDDWSPNSTKNKMEKQDDGTYRLVKTNRSLSVKTYGYKLTVGSWSVNQYPNDNVALKVTAAGNYNVVFTYNPKNGQLSHELVPIYTITASANPATAGTITGAGTYAKDASVTLEATPNAGYKFVNWTVGGMEKSTETTYSFTASANVNAVANFELSDPEVPTYAISVSANDDAMGTVTGAGDYTEGSSVTLTATPKAGYRFVNWTVGSEVKSTEATYSFTASEALTIVANFEAIPKYDITVKAVVPEAWTSTTIGIHYWGDGISGTSTPVATEKDGNWNKYTIKDVLEGQSVNVIFLNGTSWGDDKSNQTADITGITEDKCFQISAKTLDSEGKCTFTEVDCAADIKPEGDVYTMMGVGELGLSWDLATTGNDMTKQTDGTYTLVKEGLDLATTGNYEYKVIKNHSWDWSVPSGNTNQKLTVDKDGTYTITFTLSADKKKLTADAVRNTRTVAVTAENGKVEGIENNGVYILGKEVTLTATANDHYVFVNWTKGEEIVSTENPYIFNLTADVDLVANFAKKTYTVTATATNGTVEGADTYEHGAEVTLTATAAEGYEFVNWTENEEEVSTDAEYTFEVLADHNLVANFKKKTYTVTATATNGTVTGLVEGGIYEHGATATLTATPAFDYEFEKWSNGATENPLTITVAEDVTLKAVFAEVAATEKKKSGVFSISAHKTATFATGNLQYNVGTQTWRFAKQQYQVVGEQNIQLGHPDFAGWIDMFGYSADGKFGVNPSNKNEDYAGEFVDWGTLFPEEGWSTLSKEDWKYLLEERTNAATLQQVAEVDTMLGILLFPDAWVMPEGVTPTEEKVEYEKEEYQICNFTYMHYTLEQWAKLEEAGAVFLPAAGRRTGGWGNKTLSENVPGGELDAEGHYKHFDNCNEYAYYWTSTKVGENVNYLINCRLVDKPNDIYSVGAAHVDWAEKGRYGQSVRLAKVVYDKHTVIATAENGTVTGAGEYTHGTEVTLTATPAFDYQFVKWSNGLTENPLTITVTDNVTLEANFKEVTATEKKESGKFSISAHKTATFATGNLQHNVGTGEWRFAKQQYQVVGEQNIQLGHPDFTGWIDMLGYSADGKFGVNPSNANADYAEEFVDWGTLFPGEGWSTLSKEDWKYLLEDRTDAANLQQVAKVGDILGIMLFPDNWTLLEGCNPTPEINHDPDDGEETKYDFTTQNYTLEQWTKLEQAGAVFLPAAGRRTGGWGNTTLSENVPDGVLDADGHYKHFDNCNEYAYYWTSTKVGENVNYLINCRLVDKPNDIYSVGAAHVDWAEKGRYGQSVRLAKVVYDKHTVTATAVNGTVTGLVEGGIYEHGATATLTATPAFDYQFVKWSNGLTENPLTITVEDNIELEAVFAEVAATEKKESGVFSISAHKTATFATGNLQYNVGTQAWRFAKQQYQVVGEQNINLGDPAFTGWIDMLGWSTNDEGNNFGVNPSNVNELYDGEFVDWGTKMGAEWSTLSADDWKYLLNTREDAATLKQIAKVGDILGLLLFPDGWVMPEGVVVEAEKDEYFEVNIYNYTLEQWTQLEQVGALFLPAAGRRTGGYGNMINYDQVEEKNEEMLNGGYYRHQDNTNIYCYYWTSTINEETKNVSYLHNIVALGNDEYTIGNGAIWGEKGRYGQSVRLAKVVYDTHTVTAIAENGTVTGADTTYTHGTEVTLTATPDEGYEFVNWTAGKDTVSTEATYTFIVEADVELVANFQEVAPVITHTIKWYTAVKETASVVTVEEGAAITKPETNPEMEGYVFMGWTNECFVAEDGSDFTAIEDFGTADADKEYYAVFAKETTTDGGGIAIVTDLLNRATTDATNQNYVAWSGKTATSSAVYAGQSAGSNESIQLRSNNNNSGIVTTTSGGNAKKVTIKWHSSTSNGRTVSIYGKNSAYTQATDLYNTNNQGTELGTIVCGTSTELTISGEYAYIGIRSKSGAMYLISVSIDWETKTSGEPTTTYSNYMTTCTPEEYTIEWSVNGVVTKTTTVVEGDALVLPEAPAAPDACSEKVFKGWATTATVNADGSAITWVKDTIVPENDNTYYAVFATEIKEETNETYTKTATVNIADYATANSWVDATKYANVIIDQNITATAISTGSNTGKYYANGNNWRLYQTEKDATLTINATEGVTINNVTVTYGNSNSGVLTFNTSKIASGTTVEVNAPSVTFGIGNTGTATNGQVRVTKIAVDYTFSGTLTSTTYADYSTICVIPEYTVTFDYSVDAGYITVNDDRISEKEVKYEVGTELTVKALTFNNYRFDAWEDEDGNELSTEPTYTFTVTKDVVLKAIITYIPGAVGTGVENNNVVTSETMKVIQNGRLFIIREGKIYNAQGQVVR